MPSVTRDLLMLLPSLSRSPLVPADAARSLQQPNQSHVTMTSFTAQLCSQQKVRPHTCQPDRLDSLYCSLRLASHLPAWPTNLTNHARIILVNVIQNGGTHLHDAQCNDGVRARTVFVHVGGSGASVSSSNVELSLNINKTVDNHHREP